MRRFPEWIRERVILWLGFDDALRLEREQRAALAFQMESMAKTNHGLATALQATVAQLNRNTVMMQRWAEQSATLQDIERRHARREAIGNGNGHSSLVLPPGVG
jgi:hypothetical protein